MDYSLSPVTMFANAGPISKAVMALLVGASIWTWVLIIDGTFVVMRVAKALKSARLDGTVGVLWPISLEGRKALEIAVPNETVTDRRERVLHYINRAAHEFMTSARAGLPSLAIVASVSPFVGLFGTVWGIMSSFSGIAQTQDTSLAVVAPGIAEALAATAYELAAAIPAAVGYNRLGMAFSKLNGEISQFVRADVHSIAGVAERSMCDFE